MVAAADFLGCVWSASHGNVPSPEVQHVDLWWQPAASLTAARDGWVGTLFLFLFFDSRRGPCNQPDTPRE